MEEYSPVLSASPGPPTTPFSIALPTIFDLELDHLYAKPLGGGADVVHNNHHHPYFKPQLPALSLDQARRAALPSGRPGSPFSFGNPPTYPRVSPGAYFSFLVFYSWPKLASPGNFADDFIL